MKLHDILIRSPVNRVAARVVSQKHAATDDAPLSKADLVYLLQRLERKHRLLKLVLGIRTKAQHVNLRYKHSRNLPQFRKAQEPRAFTEYIRVGHDMQRLIAELAAIKNGMRATRDNTQWTAEQKAQHRLLMLHNVGVEPPYSVGSND
jgi:hypothetical protein